MIKNITFNNFREETATGKCVLDFWASWCGPCRMMAPIIDSLAEKYSNINFYKINVDEEEDLANAFAVNSIPMFVYMSDGAIVSSALGYMSEEELIKELKI